MRRRYVVCYDIADPKRLYLVHRKMNGFGDPIQYSVFRCDLSRQEKALMVEALLQLINQKEDRIVIVDTGPVGGSAECCIEYIGRHLSPVEERASVIV